MHSVADPMAGVRNGNFHITVDFIGHVFRASSAGASVRNSYALDWIYGLIGYVSVLVALSLLWCSTAVL